MCIQIYIGCLFVKIIICISFASGSGIVIQQFLCNTFFKIDRCIGQVAQDGFCQECEDKHQHAGSSGQIGDTEEIGETEHAEEPAENDACQHVNMSFSHGLHDAVEDHETDNRNNDAAGSG